MNVLPSFRRLLAIGVLLCDLFSWLWLFALAHRSWLLVLVLAGLLAVFALRLLCTVATGC